MSRPKKGSGEQAAGVSERVAELRREFEAYRASTPVACRRRFPTELKEKVLTALDEEISLKAICAACRITTFQIYCWQEDRGLPRRQETEPAAQAQVLKVVPQRSAPSVGVSVDGIEIRIGRWHLQLRLDQTTPCCG